MVSKGLAFLMFAANAAAVSLRSPGRNATAVARTAQSAEPRVTQACEGACGAAEHDCVSDCAVALRDCARHNQTVAQYDGCESRELALYRRSLRNRRWVDENFEDLPRLKSQCKDLCKHGGKGYMVKDMCAVRCFEEMVECVSTASKAHMSSCESSIADQYGALNDDGKGAVSDAGNIESQVSKQQEPEDDWNKLADQHHSEEDWNRIFAEHQPVKDLGAPHMKHRFLPGGTPVVL